MMMMGCLFRKPKRKKKITGLETERDLTNIAGSQMESHLIPS